MLARRKGWALVCAAALLSCAAVATNAQVASAQPKAAAAEDPKEQAKVHYQAGNEKFKAGDYAGALPEFQQADQLYPGAAPKQKIAVCLDKLGKHREAIDAYRAFIASNPSEKYADRVQEAGARIAELESTLPAEVNVIVSPPDAADVQISVDGEPKTGPALQLPAGQHTIVVTAQGFQPLTEVVTVKGAEKRDLALTLVPAEAAAPPPPPPPPPPAGETEAGAGGGSDVPAYVTLGIAGAGVVLGTVFGIMALGAKSDFDDEPTNENADDAERAALIADMSFGVALTFGITGIVLLFTGGDEEAPAEEEAAALPELTPYGGPNGGGLAATWTF